METKHKLALSALLIASIIWGATPAIMKETLNSVPIFSLAFIRFGVAALLVSPFIITKLKIAKKDIPLIMLSALFGITFNIAFFFWGLTQASALSAGIITAATPIFTLLFARLFLGEHITKKLSLGAALGILGIIVIIGKDILTDGVTISPAGDILLIFSTIAFVLYEMLSKRLFKTYSSFQIAFLTFVFGAASFLPATIFEFYKMPYWYHQLSNHAIIGMLFGILFSSLTAYMLWDFGLSKIGASRVGFFFYLDPVISTIFAVVLLSEKITPAFLAGSLCIIGGLFIAEGRLPYHHLRKTKTTP